MSLTLAWTIWDLVFKKTEAKNSEQVNKKPWGLGGQMDLLSSWNEWIPGSVCLFSVRVCFRLAVCVRQTFLSVDYLLPEKVWALYSWIAIEFLVSTDQYSGRILDFRLTSGVHPATLPGEWCWASVAWAGSLGPGNAWVWGICRFPWFSVAQCGAATLPYVCFSACIFTWTVLCSYSGWFFLKYKMKMSSLT